VSNLELEQAWEAVERGASLAEACEAAGVRGAARGPLLGDLRCLLAGEARLARLLPAVRDPGRRLVALRVLAGEAVGERELARARIDPDALRDEEARLLERATPVRRLALEGSVSLELAGALHASLGAGAPEFLSASWRPAALTLRVNVARTTRATLRERLAAEGVATEPGRWSPWALVVQEPGPLPPTPAFDEGLFEVQDEASQLVARLVDPLRSAPTIDACAGAGGKTLALCALLGKRGQVVALDPSKRRLAELKKRAARAQAFNLLVQPAPRAGQALAPPLAALAGRAARVLVDAPCSGLGALRRKPDVARRIDAELLARLPEQQLAIAREALPWLRPEGRLVYATCTPLAAENEAVVARLVAEERLVALPQREWVPAELAELVRDPESPVLRLLPHVHGTDAFTVHVLRRA
jgi:16S rRNA (cytosine967-C5)-methyltransferase